MTTALDNLRIENPMRADYTDRLIEAVQHQHPAYRKAEVACYVVRGIVYKQDVEYQCLVEQYGEPTAEDWALAERTYGSRNSARRGYAR